MEPALPGEELIEAGLRDLRERRETVEALLVAIGAPRLRRLGVATKLRNAAVDQRKDVRITGGKAVPANGD